MSFFTRLFGKKEPQRPSLDPVDLMHAFKLYVDASTWSEKHRIVEQNAVLLDPEADELLRMMAAAVYRDPRTRSWVKELCDLLQYCREVGTAQAFAEIEQTVSQVMAELASSGTVIRTSQELEAMLATRLDLVARLEAAIPTTGHSKKQT